MAFDGSTVAALAQDLRDCLTGARIAKIAQTEADDLILTCKTAQETPRGRQIRLLLSANASLPVCMMIEENRPSPQTAPAFCMLLRKHLANGRILAITQPDHDRILRFQIGHTDELGDPREKTLVIEMMGKHSNIIFIDEQDQIIDAIRRVPPTKSAQRTVLPGFPYFLPTQIVKKNPLLVTDIVSFSNDFRQEKKEAAAALTSLFSGFSKTLAQELCFRSGTEPAQPSDSFSYEQIQALYTAFAALMEDIKNARFTPCLYTSAGRAAEFAVFHLESYLARKDILETVCTDTSALLDAFYRQKSVQNRIKAKSADLRQVVNTTLERTVRKYDLQRQQLKDTEKRDKYRNYGELLTVYGYSAEPGADKITVTDYHTDQEVTIPLDPTLTPAQNAQRYFTRYNKLKRTAETLGALTEEVAAEIEHLKSVKTALDLSETEEDLAQIRKELADTGYLKKAAVKDAKSKKGDRGKATEPLSRPLHYRTPDGFDLYVGKNNFQNDRLTFHFADGEDWWFHAKGIPGSHVILKTAGREIPDRVFELAGALAASYSQARDAGRAEIDYLQRKNVKKPNGAKPGFVVYYTNYSLVADTDISSLTEVKDDAPV